VTDATTLTMVNMMTGRRDRYVGIDREDRVMQQALRWLPRANWFPVGLPDVGDYFSVKVEHLGLTWANFHVCYLQDRIATRCFVCLDAEAAARTWQMARDEQAWSEDLRSEWPQPPIPWLAVVFPDTAIPVQLYRFLVTIERATAHAILSLRRN
jgi:hypothetical protein